jgi:hypothetical protein
MKILRLLRDTQGSALAEFALSLPVFCLFLFGLIQAGLMLWALVGLQHGVEAAARCASVSDVAVLKTGVTSTPCYSANGFASSNVSSLKSYAAANTFGLNPPVSTFSVNDGTLPCSGGNLIKAIYLYTTIAYLGPVTISASSCYPTKTS